MLSELSLLIQDHFDITPDPAAALRDSELTSLDMIELAVRIEDRFGVRITEETYAQCETLEDLAGYIEQHASAG